MENEICKYCGYKSPTKFDLEAHIEYCHSQEPESNSTSCCLCKFQGSSTSDLDFHIDETHSDFFSMENTLNGTSEATESNCAETLTQTSSTEVLMDGLPNSPYPREILCNADWPENYSFSLSPRKLSQTVEVAENQIQIQNQIPNQMNQLKNIKVVKQKFKCPFCSKECSNKKSLKYHKKKAHTTLSKMESDIAQLRYDMEFSKRIELSKDEEKDARFRDKQTTHVLRIGGMKMTKEKSYKLQFQEKLTEIVKNKKIKVMDVKKNRKKEIFDVSLSKSSYASKIWNKFNKLPDNLKSSGMFISRVMSPSTTIRIKILEALAKTLGKRYSTYSPYVDYDDDAKIYFCFQKGGVQKKLTFTGALTRFRQTFADLSLTEAEQYAKLHGFKGKHLDEFVVLKK